MKSNITKFTVALAAYQLFSFVSANAQMRITEFMYSGAGGEFVEFTNVGSTAIDMTGWKYSDVSRATSGSNSISLSGFGVVAPGESVILTESTPSNFRTYWGLCAGVKIVGGHTSANLGRSDEINLYNAANAQIDRLTYNDEGTGSVKAPRTQNVSAYVTSANLGNDLASSWILSAANDAAFSYRANGNGDIASPGRSAVNTITQAFNPCPPPSTLSLNLNTAVTTNYIDGGISTNPTSISFSGVLNDPTDPGEQLGVVLNVLNNGTAISATNYTLTASSSNTSVVATTGVTIIKSNGTATVKVSPLSTGYTDITLTMTSDSNTTTFVINYAASAASFTPSQTFFHSGYSDASAAIVLDENYMVVSDDEKNTLNIYSRNHSGQPVKAFDYANILDLNLSGSMSDGVPREIDVEAAAKSPSNSNRSYWLGSLGNQSSAGSNFNLRPNRNRLFAVDIVGTGANAAFNYVGSFKSLRERIIAWGTTYNLGLAASAAEGKDPKLVDGFNVEAMAFAPDNTTMYIGFRAPLLPVSNRVNALIAPIQNFESWFGNGTNTNPSFGAPILLNLNGRGFRDMLRLSNNIYVIVAGDYDDGNTISTQLYKWNGNPADAPVLADGFTVNGLNIEGVIPILTSGTTDLNSLQVVSDNGVAKYYDNVEAKDLSNNAFKKFRSDILSSPTPLPIIFESFDANYIGKGKVKLIWDASLTSNFSEFVIERSLNGRDFEAITSIYSNNLTQSYSFTDNVCCNTAFFYRIAGRSSDGAIHYTNVKMIRITDAAANLVHVKYNEGTEQLILNSSKEALQMLTIYDASGKMLLSKPLNNNFAAISLSNLPAGVLMIQVLCGESLEYSKIVR